MAKNTSSVHISLLDEWYCHCYLVAWPETLMIV